MNVKTGHITVTDKRLVLTQTEAIVVLVKQDSLAMEQHAQVCCVCKSGCYFTHNLNSTSSGTVNALHHVNVCVSVYT